MSTATSVTATRKPAIQPRSSSFGAVSTKNPPSPEDPKSSTVKTTNVRGTRVSSAVAALNRDTKATRQSSAAKPPPTRPPPSIAPRLTRATALPAPSRPPPPIPNETVLPTLPPKSQHRTAAKSKTEQATTLGGKKAPSRPPWNTGSVRPASTAPAGRSVTTPAKPSSTRASSATPVSSRSSTPKPTTSASSSPSKSPATRGTGRTQPAQSGLSRKTQIAGSALGSLAPAAQIRSRDSAAPEPTVPSRTSRTSPGPSSASKVVRRASLKPKVRPPLTSKRPTPLDLSKSKSPFLDHSDTSSKYTSPSPLLARQSRVSSPTSPRLTQSSQSPTIRIQHVLNELRDTSLTPSSTTASFRSAISSPRSSGSRIAETVRTSDEVSVRKSPLYAVFLVPEQPSEESQASRRNSETTVFDGLSQRSSTPSPTPLTGTVSVPEETRANELDIPKTPPAPTTPPRSARKTSPVGRLFDFSGSSKIRRKPPSSVVSLNTLSALEISLGTIGAASISTAATTKHIRKISSSSIGKNVISPIVTPEQIEKETKRLRTRYKIISEIVETEKTFLADMTVMEEGYHALVQECPMISTRQKQTVFGRTQHVVTFTNTFYAELITSTECFLKIHGDQIGEARFDELRGWDAETAVGETFWSSMVRIEKAYTGYCIHQEEASQTMQELEKNETVRLWLEECKRRSQDRTKAWDIHSLLIKPVQRVLKYPLLLQELLHVTPPSHSDFESLELAAKEIGKVAERINESKRRKEICDRILAKGRKAVSSINADLAKSFGRRTDKLRSSLGFGSDWQDETSELYGDLVSKFAKQAIQVQVLARDLERWCKEYRVYLNSADALIAALKSWMTFENRYPHNSNTSWDVFFAHIEDVSSQIFPILEKTISTKCVQPLEKLYDSFKGPAALIAKHNRKAVDFARYTAMKAKDETPDKRLVESAKTFQSLHESLLEELPIFLSLVCEFVEAIVNQFTIAQSSWYHAWMDELLKITTDPFLAQQKTTDAFVGIVANFWEHFEPQIGALESFAIINGTAIARASRAPSLAALASEEEAQHSDGRSSSVISPSEFSSPPRRPSRPDSKDLPTLPPSASLLSKDQRKRLGSFDEDGRALPSPHRSLFRAFALASFAGNYGRVDGFPYLSFPNGQEFDVVFEKDERWLARIPGTDEVGWIPKSHCIEILM